VCRGVACAASVAPAAGALKPHLPVGEEGLDIGCMLVYQQLAPLPQVRGGQGHHAVARPRSQQLLAVNPLSCCLSARPLYTALWYIRLQ
jgi:hypothetical protein